MPWPNRCCQTRLTITRGVSGFFGLVSHWASSSRPLCFGFTFGAPGTVERGQEAARHDRARASPPRRGCGPRCRRRSWRRARRGRRGRGPPGRSGRAARPASCSYFSRKRPLLRQPVRPLGQPFRRAADRVPVLLGLGRLRPSASRPARPAAGGSCGARRNEHRTGRSSPGRRRPSCCARRRSCRCW